MAGGDIFATHLHYMLDYSWLARIGDALTGKQERDILLKFQRCYMLPKYSSCLYVVGITAGIYGIFKNIVDQRTVVT